MATNDMNGIKKNADEYKIHKKVVLRKLSDTPIRVGELVTITTRGTRLGALSHKWNLFRTERMVVVLIADKLGQLFTESGDVTIVGVNGDGELVSFDGSSIVSVEHDDAPVSKDMRELVEHMSEIERNRYAADVDAHVASHNKSVLKSACRTDKASTLQAIAREFPNPSA